MNDKTKQEIIAAIMSGEITTDQAKRFLSEVKNPKRKRGRPKKVITKIKQPRTGRPKSEEAAEDKTKAMALWIALERTDIPKMFRRQLISKCLNKSTSFVDKAKATLTNLIKCGMVYVAKDSPLIMFATPEDIDSFKFAQQLGVYTSDFFKKTITINEQEILQINQGIQSFRNSSKINEK